MSVPSSSTVWLVANDPTEFDAKTALERLPEILWGQQTNRFTVGDLVAIYTKLPVGAVTHLLTVTATGIPTMGNDPTRAYWRDASKINDRDTNGAWMRLRLLHTCTDRERRVLSLARLREVKGPGGGSDNFQGRRRLGGALRELVLGVFEGSGAGVGVGDDAASEGLPADPGVVEELAARIEAGVYAVEDVRGSVKVRGSAQRVFARAVKGNYGYACAVTGITTSEFLVASHIVPWSVDASIRLDPANGVCLSTLIDRAFDTGYLRITPGGVVEVDHAGLAADPALREVLAPYDGHPLRTPSRGAPSREYLQRRYELDQR